MKKTAANSPLLAAIKVRFNAKIYKRASVVMNDEGAARVVALLRQYFNEVAWATAGAEYEALSRIER